MGRRGCARLALAVALWPIAGWAYGPLGHRIAGLAAEPLLCGAARAEIRALAGNDGLDELGLWADRVRGDPAYAESAPWHYMNIADGASLDAFRHPPEGDVLWAIDRFARILGDGARPPAERLEALRFLTHFVVDVHQPLHVGRAEDRGGNTIELVVDGETHNLHQFWDTGAIALGGRGMRAYARELLAHAGIDTGVELGTPLDWARESLALRPEVYSFATRAPLDADYRRRAERITERRLALAAWRLAGTLNALFCP
jgi:nuclease S1